MARLEINRLTEDGEAYLETLSESAWEGYDMDRFRSYGRVAVGLLSSVRFYHCTLPSLGEQIESEGLVSNKQVLSQRSIDALREVYSRFHPGLDQSNLYLDLNLDNGLTRSGLLYFSTDRHIAERSSYGVPESAKDAIASLRAAAELDPLSDYDEIAQSETDRLLAGGDSTKRIIVFGPNHPALATSLLFSTKPGSVEEVISRTGIVWLDEYFKERNLEVSVNVIGTEYIVDAYDHDVTNNDLGFRGSYREMLEQAKYFMV